jgi:hypothetical protein
VDTKVSSSNLAADFVTDTSKFIKNKRWRFCDFKIAEDPPNVAMFQKKLKNIKDTQYFIPTSCTMINCMLYKPFYCFMFSLVQKFAKEE